MDRNLGLEMVRVTEAAALACARWLGKGDKDGADQAAVKAMLAFQDTDTTFNASMPVSPATEPGLPFVAFLLVRL